MNFDYSKMNGIYWNILPLDDQLEILEKYYPIGDTFYYHGYNRKPIALIEKYHETPGYTYTKKFYKIIIKILNTDEEITIHPAYLTPILRNINLKELGI